MWGIFAKGDKRLRAMLRQLHKDFAPGIEAARRAVWTWSRPMNDYAHFIRFVRTQLQKKLTQHSRIEPSGERLLTYLDVTMRMLDYTRLLPTIDLFSIIWDAWMSLMVHVWAKSRLASI